MRAGAARAHISPDEASQAGELRRSVGLFAVAAVAFGIAEAAAGAFFGSPRAGATAVVSIALGTWLAVVPYRALLSRTAGYVAVRVAAAMTVAAVGAALLQPFASFVAAMALLVPVAAALPNLDVRPLRWLLIAAWVAIVVTAAAGFLPDDDALPELAKDLVRFWGLTLASGVVLFLLHHASRRLNESAHEFGELSRLSSDLANATDPTVLGEVIARHLAVATGSDECLIYALDPETSRLAPFGSHPAGLSLEVDSGSVTERPLLGRVLHDRVAVTVDVADERGDAAERARLRARGHRGLLILPLVSRSESIGIAELAAGVPQRVDDRRLALARTLSLEAAMAIENGRLYQQLRHRSLHDPLTGLANRSLLYDRLEHALARRTPPSGYVGLLFVDLDGFKAVNDELGHAHGDTLLKLVAERLSAIVRPADTVARMGGDEFALLLEDLGSEEEAGAVAERAVEALRAPFPLAGRSVTISGSIGVALRTTPDATADALLNEADTAMYEAKRRGKGRAARFA